MQCGFFNVKDTKTHLIQNESNKIWLFLLQTGLDVVDNADTPRREPYYSLKSSDTVCERDSNLARLIPALKTNPL